MSITETKNIDIIATRPESNTVTLVIVDHLDWNDFESHARLLQDKVNTYLQFVESRQLYEIESPKLPDDPEIHIELVLLHSPSEDAEVFLGQVREFLAGESLAFDVLVRGSLATLN